MFQCLTWRRFPSCTSTSVPSEILLARDLRGSMVGSTESKLGICGAYTNLHLAWPNSPFPSIFGIKLSSVAVASFLKASCPSPSNIDSANWLSNTFAAWGESVNKQRISSRRTKKTIFCKFSSTIWLQNYLGRWESILFHGPSWSHHKFVLPIAGTTLDPKLPFWTN